MPKTKSIAVVCGGGGVWGVAWMTGLAVGLADAGVDIREARSFIGTSAGSVVSSQLTSALTLDTLYERQVVPASQRREALPPPGALEAVSALMRRSWPDADARLRAICEHAASAPTISPAQRRADIVERLGLPSEDWPDQDLFITAVDLATRNLTVFSSKSGVPLVDAVSASCAVPGVWPPAEINGGRYIDGGVWKTAENAHLAKNFKSVLILAPLGLVASQALGGEAGLAADVAMLQAGGSRVLLISANEEALRAMAQNPLNPATRQPAAEAGRRQAATLVHQVQQMFDDA